MMDSEGMADQSSEPNGEDDSYTIEIEVGSDGQITVRVESAATEGQESTGNEQQDEASGQTVDNIKAALSLALQAYQNNGQLPTNPQGEQDAAASAFGAARADGRM